MQLRSVIAVTSVVLLAGCGSVHPGSAAVVDGTSVPMAKADRFAAVYCELSVFTAAQQGGGAVDNAAVRRQAVSELVAGIVAQDLADREGIAITPSSWQFTAAERDQAAQALPDADLDELVEVLEAGQRTFAVATELGERETGQVLDETNAEEIQQAGQAALVEAIAAADVDIDPRFGLDDAAQQVAASGSLSVPQAPVGDDAPVVPATQQCA